MCPAARRGPRRCSTASWNCRRSSRTKTSRRSSVVGRRRLSPDDVGSRLRARFGDGVGGADSFGDAVVVVPGGGYPDGVQFCRDGPEVGCGYCGFVPHVGFGAEQGFEVITQLVSL